MPAAPARTVSIQPVSIQPVSIQTMPSQATTMRPALVDPVLVDPVLVDPAQAGAPQDPLAADGRLREAALERPHTVANPRRVRVR